jgi:hypothetical protein
MRFLVSIEAAWDAANRLDTQTGGPGAIFAHIAQQFQPEAFYVEAGRRKAWWVIDFSDAAELTDFTHVSIWNAGAHPTFVPVLIGEEAARVIPEAVAKARDVSTQ